MHDVGQAPDGGDFGEGAVKVYATRYGDSPLYIRRHCRFEQDGLWSLDRRISAFEGPEMATLCAVRQEKCPKASLRTSIVACSG